MSQDLQSKAAPVLFWKSGAARRPSYVADGRRILCRYFTQWLTVEEALDRLRPLAVIAATAKGELREVYFAQLADLTAAIDEATRTATGPCVANDLCAEAA